jgi:hypothetical protein
MAVGLAEEQRQAVYYAQKQNGHPDNAWVAIF